MPQVAPDSEIAVGVPALRTPAKRYQVRLKTPVVVPERVQGTNPSFKSNKRSFTCILRLLTKLLPCAREILIESLHPTRSRGE